MKYTLVCLLFLCSCSPNSSGEFEKEGAARCRTLALILAKIENREQLLYSESELKKQFESLIDLMIEARQFQQKHPDDTSSAIAFGENSTDLALEEQLRRVYAIEGGREVIERVQHESLVRLDAYERAVAKKREIVIQNR